MDLKHNAELRLLRDKVIKEMFDYKAEAGAGYTEAHVEECRLLLEEHLDAISRAKDATIAKQCARSTVLKLNELNEKAEHELIETDQREQICEYIIRAGALLGFNGENEDVTEEWREW
jgi:hypothetical protein